MTEIELQHKREKRAEMRRERHASYRRAAEQFLKTRNINQAPKPVEAKEIYPNIAPTVKQSFTVRAKQWLRNTFRRWA